MARTLWCRKCRVGFVSVAGDVPRVCPDCERETTWTTMLPRCGDPMISYDLTTNDKRFLRSLRIALD